MENVRESIACSRKFMASAAFDPWEGIARPDRVDFVARHVAAFDIYLARKKKEAEKGLRGPNRSSHPVRVPSAAGSSASGSGDSSRTSLLPKSVFGFGSPVAKSKTCGSTGSSGSEKGSTSVSLSALLKQGKVSKEVKKNTAGTLRRSERESTKRNAAKDDGSSVASGKGCGKGRSASSSK